MSDDYATVLTKFPSERLRSYLRDFRRYETQAVNAAIVELRKRGEVIPVDQERQIRDQLGFRDKKQRDRFEAGYKKSIFQRIESGLILIWDGHRVLMRHPRMLLPLSLTWIGYAIVVLYFQFSVPWHDLTFIESLSIVAAAIFGLSFLLGLSNLTLLEIIEQIESGQQASASRALGDVVKKDLVKASPVLVVWSLLWLILIIVQALTSRSSDEDFKDKAFTPENSAKLLSGFSREFSFSRAFFAAINKGIRMLTFLILPAIAWEGLHPGSAVKKGLLVLRTHFVEFGSGYLFTEGAALVLFFPVWLMMELQDRGMIHLPPDLWYFIIVYVGIGWMYVFFLEQLLTARLYLWHLKWKAYADRSMAGGTTPGGIRSVPPPSLLDDVAEFSDIRTKSFSL